MTAIDLTDPEPPPDPDATRARRLAAILAGATLVMVVFSWPLWIDLSDFPAVPLVTWYPRYPRAWSAVGLLLLILGLGAATTPWLWRIGAATSAVVFFVLILGDQLRLQPWVYQYIVMATLLTVLPPRRAVAWCAWFVASIYVYSGLSKLDGAFVAGWGGMILRSYAGWDFRRAHPEAALAMPVVEALIGLGLFWPRMRRVVYGIAVGMHALVIYTFGPFGFGHSTILLLWNAAVACEGAVLFWSRAPREKAGERWRWRERVLIAPFAVVMLLPLAERWGVIDPWPAHALYADHGESAGVILEGSTLRDIPDAARRVASPGHDGSANLRITDWARAVRGVPAYPRHRYENGVAEWIAARVDERGGPGTSQDVTIVRTGRLPVFGGQRDVRVSIGYDQIRQAGDAYWLNAHPRP